MTISKILILCSIFTIFLPGVVFAINTTDKNLNITSLTSDGKIKEYITLTDINVFAHKNPVLLHDTNYISEIENNLLCPNKTEPCLITASIRDSFTLHKETFTTIKKSTIKTFVDDIARKINIDPTDARLYFDTETNTTKELIPHIDGITLDTEKTTTSITKLLENDITKFPKTLELSYTKVPAIVTSQNAEKLGIHELISQGVSNFTGSTKTRIHNIKTALERFNGLVIAPNEEFSFTSVLGPVDGEHGYKEELVIKDNETKPEYGGGICQVSTTVFRGAIFAGLKITQRHNHSYPVHYYIPTGFDATVYVPSPDLKFINNTPGYVLLNTQIDGTKLIFKYYGTNDGRTVEMKGPYVTERQPNGAMKTYFTQIVKDKTGKIIIDDIFKSNYKSPADYPHPGDVAKLTSKPDNWSKNQWKKYKIQNGL
jgi:vancomycin resistance protein YoaR